jgi:GNAT superfamily N-acetyltransferase
VTSIHVYGRKDLMKFVVGCDLERFKRYYRTLDNLHNYFRKLGITDVKFGELGPTEESIIKKDPSHLIVWRENKQIIGHAVWHETNIDEFNDPADKEFREALERLLGKKRQFIELHEVWLKEEHREKGYGKRFFEFFENFLKKRGCNSIVYYTENPAAIVICRKRGYKEDCLKKEKWHVFCISLRNM